MDLMELYISEVGRRLPQKTRADIEAEIRSALQDLLDERSRAASKPVDDEMVLAVLKEYGDPEKVASSYVGDRYLIGPKLYPTFEKVVFIVVPITGILVLIGLGTSLFLTNSTAGNWIQLVAQTIGNLIWSVLLTIGIIALIFAILERTVPEFKPKNKDWDPHSLLKIKGPDHIRSGSLVANILFTSLALLLFNSFSTYNFSIFSTTSGEWPCIVCGTPQLVWSSTILSATFLRYLPAIDILCGLSIILSVLLLRQGHWQTWTRWSDIGLKVLSVGLAAGMLAGPSLIGITAASLTAAGFPDAAAQANLSIDLLNQLVRLALGLTIVLSGVAIVEQLIRLLHRSKPLA
ncbi:MAG: hypothetical protein ABSG01_16130 [Anaerolineales bacterium]|jgi:hypothetical protein